MVIFKILLYFFSHRFTFHPAKHFVIVVLLLIHFIRSSSISSCTKQIQIGFFRGSHRHEDKRIIRTSVPYSSCALYNYEVIVNFVQLTFESTPIIYPSECFTIIFRRFVVIIQGIRKKKVTSNSFLL